MAVKKRKRRWLAFSLRTALILLCGCAVWLAWIVPRAQQQKKAADWVRSFEREPYYSFQFDSAGKFQPNASPSVPEWLQNLLGIDYFSGIEMIHLDDKPVKDISLVSHFHGLRHFELSSGEISDITPLRYLTNLEHVSLSRNPIDDISALSNLKKLKRFYAFDTKVHDLTPLQGLSNLENVILMQTEIDDVSALANHSGLKLLDISRTPIADLSPLRSLKNLSALNVSNTNVTREEVDELQAALPNCKITH